MKENTPLQSLKKDIAELREIYKPADAVIISVAGNNLKKLFDDIDNLFNFYLPKEREVIEKAFNEGMETFSTDTTIEVYQGEQYYQETFNSHE